MNLRYASSVFCTSSFPQGAPHEIPVLPVFFAARSAQIGIGMGYLSGSDHIERAQTVCSDRQHSPSFQIGKPANAARTAAFRSGRADTQNHFDARKRMDGEKYFLRPHPARRSILRRRGHTVPCTPAFPYFYSALQT